MKESVLFKYLLNSHFLCIDSRDVETMFSKDVEEHKEKLKTLLGEEQYKEVRKYILDFENHMFEIRDIECFKMLYLGIALGMEVGDFIHKEDEKER